MGKKHKTIVTHLEMLAEPRLPPAPRPLGKYALMRAEKPPVHFYRYLYHEIGSRYVWVNPQAAVGRSACRHRPARRSRVYILYCGGVPAGFSNSISCNPERAELSFLGVMPEHVGKGFGRFLLCEAIALAWARGPKRLIVQTCTLDHPRALPLYQRHGFTPYAQEEAELEEMD